MHEKRPLKIFANLHVYNFIKFLKVKAFVLNILCNYDNKALYFVENFLCLRMLDAMKITNTQ